MILLAKTHRPIPALRRIRAGSSVEYMMIVALVVIPIALLSPIFLKMITLYTARMAFVIRLPFG